MKEKDAKKGGFAKLPARAKRAAMAKMSAAGKLKPKNKEGVRTGKGKRGVKEAAKNFSTKLGRGSYRGKSGFASIEFLKTALYRIKSAKNKGQHDKAVNSAKSLTYRKFRDGDLKLEKLSNVLKGKRFKNYLKK